MYDQQIVFHLANALRQAVKLDNLFLAYLIGMAITEAKQTRRPDPDQLSVQVSEPAYSG